MKRIFIIIQLFITVVSAYSQINLNNAFSGDRIYNIAAPEYVKMLPGFEYKPDAQTTNYFRAYIDPNAILPISYLEQAVDPENRPLDFNLAVGTTPGQASVSLSGAATYSIPIFASPGTAGMQPQVSLVYSSQGGNGLAGYGWNIAGLSAITRVGQTIYHDGKVKGVDFSDDRFAMDGQRLIKILDTEIYGGDGTSYYPEVFNGSKIISHGTTGQGPEWFEVIGKDGSIVEYGKSDNSRLTSQRADQTTITWYISKITDPNGNYMQFLYDKKPLEIYIKEIQYTGNSTTSPALTPYNSIKFYYGERTDKSTAFVAGSRLENNLLLDHINVVCEQQVIKSYKLKYYYDFYSKLNEVEEYNKNGERYNSLVFGYDETQQVVNAVNTDNFGHLENYFVTYEFGDYNGDGITDIATIGSNLFDKIKQVKISYGTRDGETFIQGPEYSDFEDRTRRCVGSGDFNGDGNSDLLFLFDEESGSFTMFNYYVLFGYPDILIKDLPFSSGHQSTASYPITAIIDADGDGFNEIVRCDPDFNSYTIIGYNKTTQGFFNKGYFTFDSKGDKAFYHDFNGDGKTEIMMFCTDGSSMIFEFVSSGLSLTINQLIGNNGFPSFWHESFFGDFNGDSKTDILTWTDNVDSNWELNYYDGKGWVKADLNQAVPDFINKKQRPNSDNFFYKYSIGDFNGDGKKDFAEIISSFSSTAFNGIVIHCFNGQNYNIFIQDLPFVQDLELISNPALFFIDINGDGGEEFHRLRTGGSNTINASIDLISLNQNNKSIRCISNGVNKLEKFEYALMTDSIVYTRSFNIGDNYREIQYPLRLVLKQSTDLDGDNFHIKNYKYKDALLHLQGKGFLGFKEIQTSSNITPIYSVTKNELNSTYYLLQPTESFSFKYDNQYNKIIINSNDFTNQLLAGFESTNKVFLPWQSKITEKDFATGNKKTTEITVDSYGNPLTQKAKYFDTHIATIEKASVLTEYQDYWSANNIPSKPRTIISTVNRYDQATITKANKIAYDSKGNTTSTIDYFGLPKAVTTFYSDFTPVGLPKTTTVTAAGVTSRTSRVEYDNKYRFVTLQTDAEGYSNTTIHDPAFGNKLSTTNANEQTLSMQYDGFGSPIMQTDNLGVWSKTELKWYIGTTRPNVLYYSESTSNNGLTSANYFDKLGRTLYAKSTDPNGMVSCTQTVYNWKGQVTSVSEPYFEGTSPTQFTTTTYHPDYGFAVSSTLPTGVTVTSTIPTPENPGRTSSVTNSATGITTSKEADCTGKLFAATDPGGTITYTYYSDGQTKQIAPPDGNAVNFTYDEYGRQKTLSDPDAGLMEYNYDALGLLIYQKDSLGIEFNMYYDKLGRLIEKQSEQTNEATNQVYVYYPATAAKGKRGALDYTQYTDENGNNTRDTYQYNEKGQVTQKTIATDNNNKTFTYLYTYDTKGNPDEYTYPTGYTIKNEYNTTNGALKKVIEKQSGKILYAPGSYNARGQMNHYAIANQSIYTRMEYDNYGLPTFIKTGHSYPGSTNIQYLETQFDAQTGNLNYRKDHNYQVNGQVLSETFAYDPVHKNHLASWQVTGQQAYTMTYATNNGNVLTKSDVTSANNPYRYLGAKPHAVTDITAPLLLPAENLQEITYNHFSSVKQIMHNSEGKRLALYYGTDGQRIKTQYFTQNTTLAETKYFIGGDYEEEINHVTGATRRIHYLPGGGMYVLDQNNDSTLYYILTDYQGNHYKVINEQGFTIEHYSFDAWGKRRNATDWSYNNVPVTFLFNRGYTGHEHLDAFGLINMNGRVYDPVIARFLSPDNYVQLPDNTQGFNRYSYCLNNPLVYTDPSGENPVLMLAGIFAATYMGVSSALFAGIVSAQSPQGFWYEATKSLISTSLGIGLGGFMGSVVPGVDVFSNAIRSAVPTAIVTTGNYGYNTLVKGEPFNWKGLGLNVGLAALLAGLDAGIVNQINGYNFWDRSITLNDDYDKYLLACADGGADPPPSPGKLDYANSKEARIAEHFYYWMRYENLYGDGVINLNEAFYNIYNKGGGEAFISSVFELKLPEKTILNQVTFMWKSGSLFHDDKLQFGEIILGGEVDDINGIPWTRRFNPNQYSFRTPNEIFNWFDNWLGFSK